MLHENIGFPESSRVEKEIDSLSGREFAAVMLFLYRRLATHFFEFSFPLLQFLDLVLYDSHLLISCFPGFLSGRIYLGLP